MLELQNVLKKDIGEYSIGLKEKDFWGHYQHYLWMKKTW